MSAGKPLFFLIAVIVSLSWCGRSDQDMIREVIEQRAQAIERKNLDRYLECVSPAYHDSQGRGYDQLKERLETIFQGFERVEYLPGRRFVYPYGETAAVVQEFTLRFRPSEGEVTSRKGKERIILKKEGKKWRIIDGL